MSDYKPGDVFEFDAPGGKPLAARLLLDIEVQCIKPKRLSPGSPLKLFPHGLLIEVYRRSGAGLTQGKDLLIPGVLVDPGGFDTGEFRVVASGEVDPAKIEFPQGLYSYGSENYLIRGEVRLPINLPFERLGEIDVRVSVTPSSTLGEVAGGFLAGSKESLEPFDLRFSPHRDEVYSALDEPVDEPYFEFAKKHGCDLSRFYEPVKGAGRKR